MGGPSWGKTAKHTLEPVDVEARDRKRKRLVTAANRAHAAWAHWVNRRGVEEWDVLNMAMGDLSNELRDQGVFRIPNGAGGWRSPR